MLRWESKRPTRAWRRERRTWLQRDERRCVENERTKRVEHLVSHRARCAGVSAIVRRRVLVRAAVGAARCALFPPLARCSAGAAPLVCCCCLMIDRGHTAAHSGRGRDKREASAAPSARRSASPWCEGPESSRYGRGVAAAQRTHRAQRVHATSSANTQNEGKRRPRFAARGSLSVRPRAGIVRQ